ncbi:SDR family NAD(P)-dependent oxidoreductase [Lacticaseibacillus zhaodongensis]|uniref:SDR family NAD(P)-dependent oxidoreductase n=1 Tax=Lacticaseibacillus zhaodongensis TaxID=2668065 RepID=UPI0012D2BB22|nr:SDR family oxidoreductase [Lacticaseibacillus zhaodongensis]
MTNLHGKVLVITGGSSGIGKTVALAAAKRGATVVLLARNRSKLAAVRAECARLSGQSAYAFTLDVSDPVAIDSVWDQIMGSVDHVDYLLNAAGFGIFETALDTPMHTAEAMLRTNVLGTMYMTRLAGRIMVEQGYGHIINIASMAGKISTPKSGVYSASKAAVIAYSNVLRMELRPAGVFVTTVNPGPVRTNFFNRAGAEEYEKSVDIFALDPQQVAKRILQALGRPVREINLPGIMAVAAKIYPLFPNISDYIIVNVFDRK